MMRPSQITERHLSRTAIVYVRQSSEIQLREHTGSTALQRSLADQPVAWGWAPDRVQVLEDDLGVSGSQPGLRPGFATLLRRMTADEVGIVVVFDISRLTRNPADLIQFAQAARDHDVLLIHGGQVVDFQNPDNEFTGLLLGLNAVRENRARAALGTAARRRKAEQGRATTTPPIGYIKLPGGQWGKDPDPAVRTQIELIFDRFDQLGSVRKVVRSLRDEGHLLIGKHGRPRPADIPAVYRVLRHPAYAGRYVFGLTKTVETAGVRSRIARPLAEQVLHEAHHDPYVSLERWTRIQARLAANHARRQIPLGRGAALAQGLLRCTKHDRTLYTVHRDRTRDAEGRIRRAARYVCRPGVVTGDRDACLSVAAARIDAMIERQLLEVLRPPSVRELETAIHEARQDYDHQVQLRQLAVARAEEEVAALERLLSETPPGHHHARVRLHARFEAAAKELAELTARHHQVPLIPPVTLDRQDMTALQDLLQNLESLWHHPRVTADHRKAVIRTAIRAVRVTPGLEGITMALEWVGGAITEAIIGSIHHGYALVRELYAAGRTDRQITDELERRGIVIRKGTKAGQPYTLKTVTGVIRKLRLQTPFTQQAYELIAERLPRGDTYGRIAAELNAQGLRHRLGRWTAERVRTAVLALKAGHVPGQTALPRPASLTPRVRDLAARGLDPEAITRRLQAEGHMTRSRRPVTLAAVKAALIRTVGYRSPRAQDRDRASALLLEWGSRVSNAEAADRLQQLGLRTVRGKPWTGQAVQNKRGWLRASGRLPAPRGHAPRPRRGGSPTRL